MPDHGSGHLWAGLTHEHKKNRGAWPRSSVGHGVVCRARGAGGSRRDVKLLCRDLRH